jgi:hypothetical protein
MKTSEIILHGYRRYGYTYIDRRFIELYTILRQIITCVGGDMSCQLSSDDSIADCLDFLITNLPTNSTINKFFQDANTTLAQAFSKIPKLEAFILWRNAQGFFNNAIYEAWSISYKRALIAGTVTNVDNSLNKMVNNGQGQPAVDDPVVTAPAVTAPVIVALEPQVPKDPSAYRYTRLVEQRKIDPSSHHPSKNVKQPLVHVPTPPDSRQWYRTVFPTSFQMDGYLSTFTGPHW